LDFRDSSQEAAFRERLRSWLSAHAKEFSGSGDEYWVRMADWHRALYEGGFFGLSWPRDYGGQDLPPVYDVIVDEELVRAGAPPRPSVGYLVHGIGRHGSDELRKRFLPGIINGSERWCQGFSEPGAGSDLAALRTSAVIDGDHFVLNGQKIWTTFGPWADWIFVLARTDSKDRYGGISFILTKLDTPGITVRPLRQITGESEFGEVFLENARVPKENLVGKIGEGWRIAMTVLGYERGAMSLAYAVKYGRDLQLLADACKEHGRLSGAVREKLARLVVENEVMRANGIRTLANFADGKVPGPESSIEKIYWSEFDKRFRETALDLLGPGGQLLRHSPHARPDVDWAREFLWSRAGTIYSGSSEIQRNIIAKRVLNLPQDPR